MRICKKYMFMFLMLGVVLMAGCGSDFWGDNYGKTSDITSPVVNSTTPANLVTGVAINSNVAATFSEVMDSATITSSTVTLKQGATVIPSAVTYAGKIATLNPTSNLSSNTVYTATVTTGVKDLAGNSLAVNKTWSFTTGTVADTTAPTVSFTNPANSDSGVYINDDITATFSEAMDAPTITTSTFILKQGTTVIPGTVTYVGNVATFNPTSNLVANTVYTGTITTGVKDLADNALAAEKTWSFTTGTTVIVISPTISTIVPVDLATGVAVNANITATFSEAMDSATISTATFSLKQGATVVLGAVTYLGTVATFNPTNNLSASTTYTATITTGAKNSIGDPLAASKVWSFTTGTVAALGPSPVNLGTAGNFVILSKSGIDTVPTSAITGNIGVSPIDRTALTGFSEAMDSTNTFSSAGQVTGNLYAADYTSPTSSNLTTAISNMETAFTDAAGRPTPDFSELGSGDISGMTLAPGLYKWGTGVLISTDVYLNGGPNDVWIFQISGGITQASGTRIYLTGGALPKNVFWQTFGAVALGTTAHMEGIILCQTEITLATGATINGRLLSQTAVTLDQSTVIQPAP